MLSPLMAPAQAIMQDTYMVAAGPTLLFPKLHSGKRKTTIHALTH
jgi:hypothetical protein